MKTGMIKNIVIISLVVLCVVQVGQLWYGDSLDRSFFAGLLTRQRTSTGSYAYDALVRPYRIILNRHNDGEPDTFYIKYNDYTRGNLKTECDKAIVQVLKRGSFVKSMPLDFDKVFSTGAVLYEYKFDMPSSIFCDAFSVNGNSLTSKLKSFNAVAVSVDGLGGSGEESPGNRTVTAYFLNYEDGLAYEYVFDDYGEMETLTDSIEYELRSSHAVTYYMPQKEIEAADGGLFAAKWTGGELLYYPVRADKPYMENDSLTMKIIEKKISFLFENPGLILSDTIDNIFTYRDDNAVVKYWPENVVEYSNYKTPANKNENSFLSAFSAAVDLVTRDEAIANDYYLAYYKQEDDAWNFYFDFAVNDLPVAIPLVMKSKINMDYAIEISVANDTIIKYKKLAYNFTVDYSEQYVANRGFTEAYTGANGAIGDGSEMRISKADLAYSADERTSTLKLAWFFETESRIDDDVWVVTPSTYPAKME